MVLVRVGEEKVAESQAFRGDHVEHRPGVGTGVESRGLPGLGVPDEVSIDGHVLMWGVEHGEAALENRLLRIPLAAGQFEEGVALEPEGPGDGAKHVVADLAALDRHAGPCR
jgi:hypothetical protein